jgi:hypothetical protein
MAEAEQAAGRAANEPTRLHLADVAARIEAVLYPNGRTARR